MQKARRVKGALLLVQTEGPEACFQIQLRRKRYRRAGIDNKIVGRGALHAAYSNIPVSQATNTSPPNLSHWNQNPAMRPFMQEAIKDALILSALIILPMSFLGPGWRVVSKDDRPTREHFARQHISREEKEEG